MTFIRCGPVPQIDSMRLSRPRGTVGKVDIINPSAFQFTQPTHHLGKRVETRNGRIGYVVGLVFYPDTATWSYGIYLADHQRGEVSEVWYDAEEITAAPPQRYIFNDH